MFGRNGQMVVASVITPPEPFITKAEAKAHLRLDADLADQDVVITALIAAATAYFEGPMGKLGRAVAPQLLEVALDGWPRRLDLPCPPLLQIESVRYVDGSGEWQDLNVEDLLSIRPRIRGRMGDVLIRYWAGYGVKAEGSDDWTMQPPAPLKQAALSLLAHWFAVREAVNIGNITSEVPLSVKSIVDLYRVRRA